MPEIPDGWYLIEDDAEIKDGDQCSITRAGWSEVFSSIGQTPQSYRLKTRNKFFVIRRIGF